MDEQKKRSLLESAGGAILERADYELTKLIDNLLDPNTPYKNKRKLTIGVELTVNEDRNYISYQITATPKLAPVKPVVGSLSVLCDQNGELIVRENTAQIPGQKNIFGDEQAEPNVIRLVRGA